MYYLDSLDRRVMIWQLQMAKQRFSEVVDRALAEGPQIVTRRGREVAVVLGMDEYRRLRDGEPDFKRFLMEGPSFDDLEIERSPDTGARNRPLSYLLDTNVVSELPGSHGESRGRTVGRGRHDDVSFHKRVRGRRDPKGLNASEPRIHSGRCLEEWLAAFEARFLRTNLAGHLDRGRSMGTAHRPGAVAGHGRAERGDRTGPRPDIRDPRRGRLEQTGVPLLDPWR